jgi:transcriptional regulator with XRE-family HTH domain
MPFDWTHLASALKEARKELGITQAGLADAARVSLKTVKNLERGHRFTRWPDSADLVAAALGKPEGWARAVALRRETPADQAAHASVADATPIPLRLALRGGAFVDYDVVTFEVEGEPVTVGAFIKSGVSLDEQGLDVLRKQLEAFGRIKGHIHREAQGPDDATAQVDND